MLLSKIRVVGHSMMPGLKQNQIVIVSSIPYLFRKPKIGDIVVLKREERYIIKRIVKIAGNKIFVEGDNKKASTDSRNFGWIERREIVGKVIDFLSF